MNAVANYEARTTTLNARRKGNARRRGVEHAYPNRYSIAN
jgi:hypothetical protein